MSNESESASDSDAIIIAYALPRKKINTFITPSLLTHTKHHNINLIPINPQTPLTSQPTFHSLIHKLYNHDWILNLHEFHTQNPHIPIIDLPSSINRLHNRDTMLEFIPQLNLPCIGIPKQISLDEQGYFSNFTLKFPVIAKPKAADGKPDSHKLSLVFDSTGLQKVKQQGPLVVQEFVNHGGVIFKVYVAGKHVKCVKRKSLPNSSDLDTSAIEDGVLPFSNISNLPTNTSASEVSEEEEASVGMPPSELVDSLAAAVREYTKLNLFNIDLIRDVSMEDRYLVIDINYFPGYAKCPGYEAMLTDFFLDVVHKRESTVD